MCTRVQDRFASRELQHLSATNELDGIRPYSFNLDNLFIKYYPNELWHINNPSASSKNRDGWIRRRLAGSPDLPPEGSLIVSIPAGCAERSFYLIVTSGSTEPANSLYYYKYYINIMWCDWLQARDIN